VTLAINAIMIAFYTQVDGMDAPYIPDNARTAILALSILHVILSVLWTSVFLWNWAAIIIYKGVWEYQDDLEQENKARVKQGKEPIIKKATILHKAWYLVTDGWFIYRFIYLGFSIAGLSAPATYSFHLLDLSIQNAQVRNVLKAVTQNGTSLLLTALLGLITIYCYTMIAFFYLRADYMDPLQCTNIYSCFTFTLTDGIRSGGGIGDVLQPLEFYDPRFWPRFIFDLTFYMLIIIILLNVVFGIILDTFGELRDDRQAFEEDIKTKCFICALPDNTFQQKALGFKYHIKSEHNLWNYVYFFTYLDLKSRDEYTFAEEYVYDKKKASDISFFPIEKAICLQKVGKKKKDKGKKKKKESEHEES